MEKSDSEDTMDSDNDEDIQVSKKYLHFLENIATICDEPKDHYGESVEIISYMEALERYGHLE
jgi:hypothetical protein